MRKTLLLSVFLIALLLLSGCKEKASTVEADADSAAERAVVTDDRIKELGTPTYKEVEAKGFRILPFPGLSYNGIRDGKQAFYATNQDYTFAIYTDQGITESDKSFEQVILAYEELYKAYVPSCREIGTSGWVTQARAFACRYYIATVDVDYKSVVFYREGDYVETILAVWGTNLQDYEYIFDAFNAQAVKWD